MTKYVDVKVTFNNGSTVINKVQVDKGKYASMQTRANNKTKALIADITLEKRTKEDALKNWNDTVRTPWINMVTEPLNASYPEEVRNLIKSVEPVTKVLELNV